MVTNPTEIVKLKPGDQHVVSLNGLAMAGYEWVYENSDRKTVSVQKAMTGESPAGAHLGGSATEQFTITALKKGEAILRFRHVRLWENKAPREEKQVKLVVE